VLVSACATSTPESEEKRVGAPVRDPSLICDELVTKVRFPPYPSSAFRQGTEGWVLLEFALDGTGAAKNIVVVSSSPKGVFERSALNGLMLTEFDLKAVRSKCQSLVTYTLH
jgi:protein TonB